MGPLIASFLCALPRWRLWQNCHFRHICQICRFRQLLWGPYTALCFASLAIVAKLSFSPYLPNSPLSPTFMGPLHCFVFCLVGDCGKIVIFAIFAKFAAFANFYGPPSLLCALPRWRLWQNCHFRHICQIRRFRQLLWGPFTALCFASLAIVAKLSFSPYLPNSALSPTFMGPLYCFVLCLVGDCGKIVIFAIFAKFAAFANFYGPPSLLCVLPRWRLWQNCHFRHICQIRHFHQLLWGPYTALCFALLVIVAKLSFSPYLPNLPLSPTFMGLLHCFVFCLVGDCGKIVIFAIFAKFAVFANFYGAPILLCALPRWRLWQNCHFRHICQIRRFRQLLWGFFTALCFASLAIVAKLSFSPYLPNSPTLSLFCNFCCCVHFWTYLLRARLVVLSCCHSGRGEVKSEGVVGIARAFLCAGARSVLVSLWAIDDEATLLFMSSFYQHLVDGKSASTALQQTMKSFRESKQYCAIKHWALFVQVGDDVTLEFPKKW